MDIKEIAEQVSKRIYVEDGLLLSKFISEKFAEALIESYKAELLKGIEEPVAEFKRHPFGDYTELSFSAGYSARRGDKLYTSDQVAAAIIKATKPLEEEVKAANSECELFRKNGRIVDANKIVELSAQLAVAQEEMNGWRNQAHQSQSAFDRLQDQLAKAEQRVAEWQPIETAPKGEAFLAVLSCGDHQTVCTMRWPVAEAKNSRVGNGEFILERVTHWMPLPKPPALDAAIAKGEQG